MITLTIPGTPIAKKRPRFVKRGNFARAYNDQQTEEGRFLWEVKQQFRGEPLAGALVMYVTFYMPRPKGHFGTGRNVDKLKSSAPVHHTKKPDLDNLVKFVKDCLNEVAWVDDSQVVTTLSNKKYGKPRTEISIWPAPEDAADTAALAAA